MTTQQWQVLEACTPTPDVVLIDQLQSLPGFQEHPRLFLAWAVQKGRTRLDVANHLLSQPLTNEETTTGHHEKPTLSATLSATLPATQEAVQEAMQGRSLPNWHSCLSVALLPLGHGTASHVGTKGASLELTWGIEYLLREVPKRVANNNNSSRWHSSKPHHLAIKLKTLQKQLTTDTFTCLLTFLVRPQLHGAVPLAALRELATYVGTSADEFADLMHGVLLMYPEWHPLPDSAWNIVELLHNCGLVSVTDLTKVWHLANWPAYLSRQERALDQLPGKCNLHGPVVGFLLSPSVRQLGVLHSQVVQDIVEKEYWPIVRRVQYQLSIHTKESSPVWAKLKHKLEECERLLLLATCGTGDWYPSTVALLPGLLRRVKRTHHPGFNDQITLPYNKTRPRPTLVLNKDILYDIQRLHRVIAANSMAPELQTQTTALHHHDEPHQHHLAQTVEKTKVSKSLASKLLHDMRILRRVSLTSSANSPNAFFSALGQALEAAVGETLPSDTLGRLGWYLVVAIVYLVLMYLVNVIAAARLPPGLVLPTGFTTWQPTTLRHDLWHRTLQELMCWPELVDDVFQHTLQVLDRLVLDPLNGVPLDLYSQIDDFVSAAIGRSTQPELKPNAAPQLLACKSMLTHAQMQAAWRQLETEDIDQKLLHRVLHQACALQILPSQALLFVVLPLYLWHKAPPPGVLPLLQVDRSHEPMTTEWLQVAIASAQTMELPDCTTAAQRHLLGNWIRQLCHKEASGPWRTYLSECLRVCVQTNSDLSQRAYCWLLDHVWEELEEAWVYPSNWEELVRPSGTRLFPKMEPTTTAAAPVAAPCATSSVVPPAPPPPPPPPPLSATTSTRKRPWFVAFESSVPRLVKTRTISPKFQTLAALTHRLSRIKATGDKR